ncbi:MAG: ABC transporter ATP-binding protein [Candidatus Omnitrophica bacterium]|nr:ABC transporter ATP-binding protein [Candidatus Omnitrophota bacterium]
MLEARHVHKTYRTGAVPLHVLKGVNLTVAPGEFVAVTGPSGAGKSTLLHVLAGLDVPSQGDVLWEGRSLAKMTDRQRAHFRNRTIGVIFQFYHLLPELSALENVMLPALVEAQEGRRELRPRALECLEQVRLKARAAHKPSQLSGGELQRLAMARALINRPKVIFCDEPTGNLDSQTGQAVMDLLVDLHQRQHMALVLVTHEHAFAQLADRWLGLQDGQFAHEAAT